MKKRVLNAILDGLGFGAMTIVLMIYIFDTPPDYDLLLKGILAAALLIIAESTIIKVNRG